MEPRTDLWRMLVEHSIPIPRPLDEHDFTEGFQDGRAWEHAESVGGTYPLPYDPSLSWQYGFTVGRNDYRLVMSK